MKHSDPVDSANFDEALTRSDLRSEQTNDRHEVVWSELAGHSPSRMSALAREWSRLTDEDIEGIDGNRRSLIERLRARYGWTDEECAMQIDNWTNRTVGRRLG